MKRSLRCLILAVIVCLLCGVCVSAAGNAPGKVGTLKVYAVSETSITLKWSGVSDAEGYYIYSISNGVAKKIGGTTKKKCEIKNLDPGKSYQFEVRAYRWVNKVVYKGEASNTVTASPQITTPAKPKNVTVERSGNQSLTISWSKVSGATGYEIYRYKDGKYKKVVATTSTSRTFTGLTGGEEYTLAVRSYRTVKTGKAYSSYSAKVTGTPIELSEEAASIHGIRYNAKVTKKVQVYNYTKKKQVTLKKGTQIATTSKSGSNYTAYLANGDKIKISSAYVSIKSLAVDSSSDYSRSAKEEFVNTRNLSSTSSYLIWLNQSKARVNIFYGSKGNWKLVRTFKVIIGKLASMSPRGTFKIRYKWAYGSLGGPEIQWTNPVPGAGNAFHVRVDGTSLGSAASHGCVRCNTEDLWYMYNNCPIGTTVYSY